MAKITLSLQEKFLRDVPLAKERVTIGRRLHNDIVLDDLAISGEHAVIVTMHHDSFLEDLNSTNGTKVNGQPVRRHYLRDGDCIELAQYRIRYVSDDSAGQTAPMLRVLNGPKAGSETLLSKAITSIGKQQQHTAVILKRSDGYFLAYIEGNTPPMLNGHPVGSRPEQLKDGDVIAIDHDRLQFLL